jgi:hypothetical protein
MQQTLQQQNRFGTGASKLLVNQGGAGAMMNGRMMAGGGMGSSLSSGLEDLRKTAGWSHNSSCCNCQFSWHICVHRSAACKH